MLIHRTFILFLIIALLPFTAFGQQMLVMKGSKIIGRFNEGDEIYFQLKEQVHHTAIAYIHEFDFVSANDDTIAYSRVSKLKYRNPGRKKYALMVALAGAGLFGVYLLNENAFGDKNETSMKGLRFIALYGIGIGAFIYATANGTVRLRGVKRLKGIAADSPLYK